MKLIIIVAVGGGATITIVIMGLFLKCQRSKIPASAKMVTVTCDQGVTVTKE